MINSRRGYTLIELLIVIAMIAIMTTALLGALIAPLREQVTADGEQAAESGLSTLFSRVVSEAHSASHSKYERAARRLSFTVGDDNISYAVSPAGQLRRDAGRGGPDTLLLTDVESFEVGSVDAGKALELKVVVRQSRWDSPVPLQRNVELSLVGAPLEVLP